MNMFWRFILVFLCTRAKPGVSMFKPASRSFYALPTDCDYYMHINNGRYLSFLDLARFTVLMQVGALPVMWKRKVYGVVAAEIIRFKKSIGIFKRFEVVTQVVYWDDKYFYIKQCFYLRSELCAFAIVKIRFLQQGKLISPAQLFEILGITQDVPPMPGYAAHMNEAEQELFAEVVGKSS